MNIESRTDHFKFPSILMGSIPNLRLRKPGLTYEDDEIAPTVGGGINKKKWYNLMPLFVALVVIAEIGFLGRLYMAKNVDLVNSWAESFYQFTTSSSSSSSSWAEDAVEVGGGEVVSGGEICEEWLERQDSVVCSRDFQTDPIFVNGGEKAQTVKVCNVSLGATEQDIKEFFSFSGEIEYVEMQSESERAQTAFVTFKDLQGAETAVLLSGATIVDQSVTIALAPDYKLPPSASAPPRFHAVENQNLIGAGSVVQKAKDVISSMLAKGFILGKDAVNKAKSFDEKMRLTSTATATVTSLDQKIGLSRKINIGTTIVNDKVKEMDQKFQVSEKTKSAIAAAEQAVSSAGSAIMKNRYFLTGTSWVTGAYSKVTKAAGEVGQKTKEKVTEEEHGRNAAQGYAQVHESDSNRDQHTSKPEPVKGLIL